MRRRHKKYNNHLWGYSIIASICLLTMGIGYAVLSVENNIKIDVTKTTPSVLDTIKELLGSNSSAVSGTGTLEKITHSGVNQKDSKVSYRYRGTNPNNYVTFNGETAGWRIIGIVDGKVKIIRNKRLTMIQWNGAGVNEFTSGDLNTYLNGEYYDGLNTESKEMIDESLWYLGGWDTSGIRGEIMYEKERGLTVYDCSYDDGYCPRNTKVVENIAIMYPSDYGYAASSECSNSFDLYNYDYKTCKNNNWLNGITEWLLSPSSYYSDYAFYVESSGSVRDYFHVTSLTGIRPTIYLKSNVQISSGDGSSSNPYVLNN